MENSFFFLFLAFHFTKISGKVRQSWIIPQVLKEFGGEFFQPLFRVNCLPILVVRLLSNPPSSSGTFSTCCCWCTDCCPPRHASPSETSSFSFFRGSLFSIPLTPIHFTLSESFHYTLQVLSYIGRKRRTTILDSF